MVGVLAFFRLQLLLLSRQLFVVAGSLGIVAGCFSVVFLNICLQLQAFSNHLHRVQPGAVVPPVVLVWVTMLADVVSAGLSDPQVQVGVSQPAELVAQLDLLTGLNRNV